jgi:phage-related protein
VAEIVQRPFIVIQPQFEAAFYFFDGVAEVEDQSGFVLIDRSGRVVARGDEFLGLTREGRTPAARDGKWGVLDARGTMAIALKYDEVSQFSGGLAAVKIGRLWSHIDRDGALIIPATFDQAGEFSSGLAPATLAGKTGLMDKSGNIAFYLDYEYAPGFLAGDEESNLSVAPSERKLQRGERLDLPHSRPIPGVGPRCHELRIRDADVTWRFIYRADPDAFVICDVFARKTRATPRAVVEAAQRRLNAYDRITRR